MKIFAIPSVLIAAFLSNAAFAGNSLYPANITTTPGTSSGTSRTSTLGYAGLNWALGGGYTPALVLGVTNVKVKTNGDTTGARLAFHLNLAGGPAPGMLKLSYLNGKEDFQGEIGAGYNFIKSAPLLGLGVNGPYVSAGIDAYLNSSIVPYASINSQGAFSKPKPRTTPGSSVASCDPNDPWIVVDVSCNDNPPLR